MALVLDFDGTITTQDTIGILAQCAIEIQKKRGRDLSPAWEEILDLYGKDHAEFKSKYHVPETGRLSLQDEIRFLNALKPVEMASVRRVEESGLFEGISSAELSEAGAAALRDGKVVLREGLSDLVAAAEANHWSVFVVSVSWSRSFIEGVLNQWKVPYYVLANEPHEGGRLLRPDTPNPMTTSADKLDALEFILRDQGRPPVVYMGDSLTDLECLTHAAGVVLSSSPDSKLLRALSRVGLEVPHTSGREDADRIVWARDFTEILSSGVLFSLGLAGKAVATSS